MITERLQGHGKFDLRLRPDTPSDVVEAIVEFGHLLITDAPAEPDALGDSGMLSAARYTGVVYRVRRSLDLSVRISGHGLLIHLGDSDGKGDILEAAWTPTTQTFVGWVTELLGTIAGTPSPLQPGTITAVSAPAAGELTKSIRWVNRRQALDYITDYYSAAYKVRPDGKVDAGPESSLFATTPQVVLADRAGTDPVTDGLPATVLEVDWDAQDWTSRVVLFGEGQQEETILVGTADLSSNPYKDLFGNPLIRKRPVSSPITESSEASTIAQAQLNRFSNVNGVVTAATDHPHVRSLVEPGDYIWAWFPEGRVMDNSQQTTHRGEVLSPLKLRVWEVRWPIRDGMGVYYRGGNGSWIDLTPFVVWETGAARLKVGAPSKRIVSRESPAVPERTFAAQVRTPNLATGAVASDKAVLGFGADNLIHNPGFDDDGSETSAHNLNGSGGTWSYDAANARGSSGFALAFDVTGQTANAVATLNGGPTGYSRSADGLTRNPPATYGDRFVIQIWARHNGTAPSQPVQIRAVALDASGTVVEARNIDIGPSLTNSWQRFSHFYDTHPSAKVLEVSLLVSSGQPAGCEIFFDDVVVRRETIPPGLIQPYASNSTSKIPDGWLECDGSAVSRTTYRSLFDVLQTIWGAGDGSTTFNLPNLAGRMLIGFGGGTGLVAGDTGGAFGHSHAGPAHSHTFADTSTGPSGTISVEVGTGLPKNPASAGHTHDVSGTTSTDGSGPTGSADPPYAAIIWMIKA